VRSHYSEQHRERWPYRREVCEFRGRLHGGRTKSCTGRRNLIGRNGLAVKGIRGRRIGLSLLLCPVVQLQPLIHTPYSTIFRKATAGPYGHRDKKSAGSHTLKCLLSRRGLCLGLFASAPVRRHCKAKQVFTWLIYLRLSRVLSRAPQYFSLKKFLRVFLRTASGTRADPDSVDICNGDGGARRYGASP